MSTIPQSEATATLPQAGGAADKATELEVTAHLEGRSTTPVVVTKPTSASSAQSEFLETIGGTSADGSLSNTPAPSVNVVISPPKSTEELIAARALKRAARKTAVREKAEGHKRAGDILFESKNYKASYPQYLEAIQLWGSNPGYFISLAGAYRKLQWYEEAAHAATRALTLDPKNSEARYIRGVARMEQRLLKPARIDFETVLEHNPTHFLARAALTEVTHFIASSAHLGSHDLGPNPVDEMVKTVDFGFPHYDGDALEIASVSDSSDCNHVGNGVQCRFYNRDGCGRGSGCVFSHAPDEKSVRDELGRNVCIYFLLDQCKFGDAKCIYSHSKAALPKIGWWTSEEQIAKVKSVMEVAERKAREQRHLENVRWKAHVKALKAAGRAMKSAGDKPAAAASAAKKGENDDKSGDATSVVVEQPNGEAKGAVAPAVAVPTAAGSAPAAGNQKAPKRSEGAKTNGKGRKPNPGKRRNPKSPSTANPSSKIEEVPSTSVAFGATTTPGFTDYQLNTPPVSAKPVAAPDAPVALQY